MENIVRQGKYDLINDTLNDYFIYIENTFLDRHIFDFFSLARKVEEIIDTNDTMYKDDQRVYRLTNPEYDKLSEYLSYSDTLQIVRDYLGEKLPQYVEKFEECLSNGIINFAVDQTDDCIEDSSNHNCYSHERHLHHTNVVFEHNYNDPQTIIHEFMHHLNCPEVKNASLTRKLLTETISIFFECDILRYMQEKGYDETDIAKILHKRIEDTYSLLPRVMLDMAMLYNFKHLGNLSDNSLEDAQKLDLPIRRKSQEEYLRSIDDFNERIKHGNGPPHVPLGYLIGTVIGLAYMQKDNPTLVEQFVKLNEMINFEPTETCLKAIDIDLNKRGCVTELLTEFEQSVIDIEMARTKNTPNYFRKK